MTGKQFADYVRWRTRTNTATFSNTDLILSANVQLEILSRIVMGDDEDTLVMPMHTNLIAGLREYPFPSSILSRIKYIEAKLDGTNYIHLDEFDLNFYEKPTDEENILSRFSNYEHKAFYDLNRKSIVLYSGAITAVEAGLKLWCEVYPAPLDESRIQDAITDLSVDPTTTSHGFPRELHELWARAVIIDYKGSREKPIPLSEKEMSFKADLGMAATDLKHGNKDRFVVAQLPPASDRGDNGQNY